MYAASPLGRMEMLIGAKETETAIDEERSKTKKGKGSQLQVWYTDETMEATRTRTVEKHAKGGTTRF